MGDLSLIHRVILLHPQVDAWDPLQASHLLEGPVGLRRNFNHRFLTLESAWDNQLRHACSAALIKRIASDVLPPGISTVTLGRLAESRTTGAQLQDDKLSLADGSNLLLSDMHTKEVRPWNSSGHDFLVESILWAAEIPISFSEDCIRCYRLSTAIGILLQDEIEAICKEINTDMCSKNHPDTPCKFWNKSYGAVPAAVSRVPFNEDILRAEFMMWPEPEPESGESLRTWPEWRAPR